MTQKHSDIIRLFRAILLACFVVGFCLSPAVSAYTYESDLTQGHADLHIISNSVLGPTSLFFYPDSGNLDMYALKCETTDEGCSCPSASDVKKDATKGPGVFLMLSSGTWCVVVHAESGASEYTLVCDFFGCDGQFISRTII